MNKGIIYFAFAILMMALSSCGGKQIKPEYTEFTSGQVGRFVVFVEEPCDLIYTEQDGAIPAQIIRLKAKLEKVEEGFEDVDYHDIQFPGMLGCSVMLVDKDGTSVQDLNITSKGELALKKLLTGKVGDIAEVEFEETFHNRDDAPGWYKNSSAFSPQRSCDISIGR